MSVAGAEQSPEDENCDPQAWEWQSASSMTSSLAGASAPAAAGGPPRHDQQMTLQLGHSQGAAAPQQREDSTALLQMHAAATQHSGMQTPAEAPAARPAAMSPPPAVPPGSSATDAAGCGTVFLQAAATAQALQNNRWMCDLCSVGCTSQADLEVWSWMYKHVIAVGAPACHAMMIW